MRARAGETNKKMMNINLNDIRIGRDKFQSVLINTGLATQEEAVEFNTDLNLPVISVQFLEDFAIGFQQESYKLFMFGKADERLFSFSARKTAEL